MLNESICRFYLKSKRMNNKQRSYKKMIIESHRSNFLTLRIVLILVLFATAVSYLYISILFLTKFCNPIGKSSMNFWKLSCSV